VTAGDVGAFKKALGLHVPSLPGSKHKAIVYSVYGVGICIATTAHSHCNLFKRMVSNRQVRRVFTKLEPFEGARSFENSEGEMLYCVMNVLLDNWPKYTLRSVVDTVRYIAAELQPSFHAAGISMSKNVTEQPTDSLLTPNQFKVFADNHGISMEDMDSHDQESPSGRSPYVSPSSKLSSGRQLYMRGRDLIEEFKAKTNKRKVHEAEMEELSGSMMKKQAQE